MKSMIFLFFFLFANFISFIHVLFINFFNFRPAKHKKKVWHWGYLLLLGIVVFQTDNTSRWLWRSSGNVSINTDWGFSFCMRICENNLQLFKKNSVLQKKTGEDLFSTVYGIIKQFKKSEAISVHKVWHPRILMREQQICVKKHHLSITEITTWSRDSLGEPLSNITLHF